MKPIFDTSNLCTDICKTIFVILEVQFHHERGLSKSRYLELFSWHGLYFHHTKIQPLLRPRSTFSEQLFWPYLLSEKGMIFFWYKIWVIIFTKSAKFSDLGSPWVRNNRVLLDFFLRLKTLLDTSTYSAMWLRFYAGRTFEDTFENTQWKKAKKMQPM